MGGSTNAWVPILEVPIPMTTVYSVSIPQEDVDRFSSRAMSLGTCTILSVRFF